MTVRAKSRSPAPSPWCIRGVDRDVRAAAKQMAHGAGMTLGTWLNRLILDAAAPRAQPGRRPEPQMETPALQTIMDDIRRLTSQIEEAEARSQPAGAAVAPLSRRVAPPAPQPDSLPPSVHRAPLPLAPAQLGHAR